VVGGGGREGTVQAIRGRDRGQVVFGDNPEAAFAIGFDPVQFAQSRDPMLAAGDALAVQHLPGLERTAGLPVFTVNAMDLGHKL